MKVNLVGHHFMMPFPEFLKLKKICISAILEQSIIVKNVEATMDIYLKTVLSQLVKDIVTTELV